MRVKFSQTYKKITASFGVDYFLPLPLSLDLSKNQKYVDMATVVNLYYLRIYQNVFQCQ